jgi:hypothetical protein
MKRRDFIKLTALSVGGVLLAQEVVASGPLMALWPDKLPSPSEGVPYSFKLKATGGVPPYTFSIEKGSLPPGLLLNHHTGEIHGTVKRLKKRDKRQFDRIEFTVTDSAK